MSTENEGRPTIDKSALIAALLSLSAAERAALIGQVPTVDIRQTPKFSLAIDAVEDIDGALTLLAKCQRANGPAEMAAAMADLAASFPALASAAQVNSQYRSKPIGHSIGVAVQRLNLRREGLI